MTYLILEYCPDHHRRSVRLFGGEPDQLETGEGRILRVRGRVHAAQQAQDRLAPRQAEQDGQLADAVRRIRVQGVKDAGCR